MAKFKLECYGWEIEAVALSLTEEQVEDIQQLMDDNGYDDISEARFELDNIGIDIYTQADMFHFTKPLDNEKLMFRIVNEADEEVLEFGLEEMLHVDDAIDDFEEKYDDSPFIAIPEEDGIERLLLCIDESKGGLFYMEFESDSEPTARDFAYSSNCIETPVDEWYFVERIFFKNQELAVVDYLGSTGKGSTTELWTLDNM